MRRFYVLSAVLILATGCQSRVQSPDSTITALTPQVVCGDQLTTAIRIDGAGFAPLPTRTFIGPTKLELPRVSITRQQDLSGSPVSDTPITIPDEPVEQSHVRWQSAQQMSFDIYPTLGGALPTGPNLPPGLYDLAVHNPDGRAAARARALTVVPPPKLHKAEKNPSCNAQGEVSYTLSGQDFLRIGDALPLVRFAALDSDTKLEQTAATAEDCSALPTPDGVTAQRCARLTVVLAKAALPPGSYRVTVQNPADARCSSTEDVGVLLTAPPAVSEIRSASICTAQGPSTIVLTGSDFLRLPGDAGASTGPQVTINDQPFASVASGCTPSASPYAGGAELCTTLTVTVPQNALPPGSYPLLVQNPAPAACRTTMMLSILSVPPPTLTKVEPTVLCGGGGSLTLTGTGFRDGATVTVAGVNAMSVSVSGDQKTAVAAFAGPLKPNKADSLYDVTLKNPDSCQAVLTRQILVTPGPSVLFIDPPAVPSSISVQLTVYGASVTPPISKVEVSLAGKNSYTSLALTQIPERPNRVLALLPKGSAAGTYDVRLTDATVCPAILPGALKVVAQPTLTLSGAAPAFGTTAQSTATTISGSGFTAIPRVYLSPSDNAAAQAQVVSAVTFNSQSSLSALVRAGLTPGDYDLLVINPDGAYGLKTRGFKITAADKPPPVISNLAPGSVVTGTATRVVVSGSGFRSPTATLLCQNAQGQSLAPVNPTVLSFTSTTVTLQATADGVLCQVRITNDDGTSFEYSALGVTGNSLNLTGFAVGQSLVTARRALGASAGRPTATARFLYAVGGDSGLDNAPLASVEAAPTGIDGALSSFFTLSQPLPSARSFLEVVNVGRFLYAVGGWNGTASLTDLLRAEILSPLNAPQITDVDVVYDDAVGLGAGQYIYRVSAVLDANAANEPNNPGGETLASDPFPLRLPVLAAGKLQLVLRWNAVPGAASYRVYRSPAANDGIGKERLLGTVPASASPTFSDNGTALTTAGSAPLPLGSTGVWRTLPQKLATARSGAGVAAVTDPNNGNLVYLYAAGGNSGTLATPTALRSVEFFTITIDPVSGNQTVSGPTAATGQLSTGRWGARLVVGAPENNSVIPQKTAHLYVLGGTLDTLPKTADYAAVGAAGQLASFTTLGSNSNVNRASGGAVLANNQIMYFGGFKGGNVAANNSDTGQLTAPATLAAFNSLGNGTLQIPRALQGTALESAFIYQIGGANGAVNSATNTTEQTVW